MLYGWQYLTDSDKDRIAKGITGNSTYGGPWHISLHPTNACNLRCKFCINKNYHSDYELEWSTLENLLVEHLKRDLKTISLSGGGEPLYYSDADKLLGFCSDNGLRIDHLNTNGILLKKYLYAIKSAKPVWVTVSMNETDPSRYNSLINGEKDSFKRVVEGIESIIGLRDSTDKSERTSVWLQLFVWDGNYKQIQDMYSYARRFNPDKIFYRSFMGDKKYKISKGNYSEVLASMKDIIREDIQLNEHRIHFDFTAESELQHYCHIEKNRDSASDINVKQCDCERKEYCFIPWYSTAIAADGNVYPCFHREDYSGVKLGNIHEDSLKSVWVSDKYKAMRQEVFRLITDENIHCYNMLESKCLGHDKCHLTFKLAEPEFYERVYRKVNKENKLSFLLQP